MVTARLWVSALASTWRSLELSIVETGRRARCALKSPTARRARFCCRSNLSATISPLSWPIAELVCQEVPRSVSSEYWWGSLKIPMQTGAHCNKGGCSLKWRSSKNQPGCRNPNPVSGGMSAQQGREGHETRCSLAAVCKGCNPHAMLSTASAVSKWWS